MNKDKKTTKKKKKQEKRSKLFFHFADNDRLQDWKMSKDEENNKDYKL